MRRSLLAAAAIFASALLLRLGIVERQGLWADEVFSLAMATGHSLEHPAAVADPRLGDYVEHPHPLPAVGYRTYLEHGVPAAGMERVTRAVFLSDTSPPLYYLLLHRWTLWVGTGDAALRLFSVLWALACLPLLWSLGKQIGGGSAAWIACSLFAFAPVAIRYSTEGRMYSLLWFLALLTAWAALRLHRRGSDPSLLVLWVVVSAAGLLTHYFYFFVWAAIFGWLLWQPGRCDRRMVALSVAGLGILVLPWYSQLPASLSGWRITQDWLTYEPRRYRALHAPFELAWSYFSPHVWSTRTTLGKKQILLLLLIALPLVAMLGGRRRGRRAILLVLWLSAACVGPLLFDALRGTFASAISRYALAGLPAAFLLIGAGLARTPVVIRGVALAALLLTWLPGIRSLYVAETRSGSAYRQIGEAVTLRTDSMDLILVHSIPSGVLGVARYLEGPAPIASWVGQLGQRRVPEDVHTLTAGRSRVLLVKTSEVGAKAPQEAYLREHARVVDETRVRTSRIITFAPLAADVFPAPAAATVAAAPWSAAKSEANYARTDVPGAPADPVEP